MQLEGQIDEMDVVDRLVELWRERFTGAFRFEQDGVIKIIYFKTGDVLSASTNDRTDSIDEILLRAGKVTREHVKQALAKRKESETLGDALLNLGFITRKELTWARRVQVIGIVRSIRTWHEGSFTGVADYLPKREEGTLFPLPQILLELIVTDTDRAKFEQAMDGGSAVFDKAPDFDEVYGRLGLNQDADEIVTEIDGHKTASDVVMASQKDAFNVYKLLEALRALGLVAKIERTRGAAEVSLDDFEAAGVADASDAWAADHTPQFDLDDTPAIEEAPPAAPPPAPPVASGWDEEPEVPHYADIPLVAPAPPPPLEPEEPQWGFDEAQIETARRADVPLRASEPVPPKKSTAKKASKPGRIGLLLLILVVIAAGLAGFMLWQWWQAKNAAPAAVAVKRPAKKPVIATTATTSTIAPLTVTTATTASVSTTTTQPPATTTTVPPLAVAKPVPVVTTAAPTTASASVPHLDRTTTGAATITNTGAATPPATPDATRAKYDAMAKDAAANTTGAFTVQFELVCETASVTRALRDGGSSVWITSTSYRGKPCYRVMWGRFATKQEAESAIASIPASLREGSKPSVVSISR